MALFTVPPAATGLWAVGPPALDAARAAAVEQAVWQVRIGLLCMCTLWLGKILLDLYKQYRTLDAESERGHALRAEAELAATRDAHRRETALNEARYEADAERARRKLDAVCGDYEARLSAQADEIHFLRDQLEGLQFLREQLKGRGLLVTELAAQLHSLAALSARANFAAPGPAAPPPVTEAPAP